MLEVKGNLLEADVDVIMHQVNCKGVMGAGVARQIRQKLLSEEEYQKISLQSAMHFRQRNY